MTRIRYAEEGRANYVGHESRTRRSEGLYGDLESLTDTKLRMRIQKTRSVERPKGLRAPAPPRSFGISPDDLVGPDTDRRADAYLASLPPAPPEDADVVVLSTVRPQLGGN